MNGESPRKAVLFDEADIARISQIVKEKGYRSFGAYVRALMERDGVVLRPLPVGKGNSAERRATLSATERKQSDVEQ